MNNRDRFAVTLRRLALPLASALLAVPAVPAAGLAQGYGPAQLDTYHYELYRGDTQEFDLGQPADWTEVTGDSVAAILSEVNKLRIVGLKVGTSTVEVREHDKPIWRAEVVVR